MLEDMEGHRCNPDMNLDFDTRWYQIIAAENEKMYGCFVPWQPQSHENHTGDEIEICTSSEKGILATQKYIHFYGAKLSHNMTPCATFETFPGLPDIDDTENKQDEAYIRLYLKTKIKIKSIIIHYDSATLTAEIGGYVGMFLGVSFIDLVLLFNVILLNMIRKLFD